MDEEDIVHSQCADVVSDQRFDPALLYLFDMMPLGQWVQVVDLYRIAGQATENIKPSVVASWLPDPSETPE